MLALVVGDTTRSFNRVSSPTSTLHLAMLGAGQYITYLFYFPLKSIYSFLHAMEEPPLLTALIWFCGLEKCIPNMTPHWCCPNSQQGHIMHHRMSPSAKGTSLIAVMFEERVPGGSPPSLTRVTTGLENLENREFENCQGNQGISNNPQSYSSQLTSSLAHSRRSLQSSGVAQLLLKVAQDARLAALNHCPLRGRHVRQNTDKLCAHSCNISDIVITMMNSFMSTQDKYKSNFQENEQDHRTGSPCDEISLFSAVHKSPEFLSQIIAERKKQFETNPRSIYVNPKFLELNKQNATFHSNCEQATSDEVKSRLCCGSQGFLHGKQLEQNKNVAISQSCSSGIQNMHFSVKSGEVSDKCISGRSLNKLAVCPDWDSATKADATIACRNLQSKSVYINPNFNQRHRISLVESGLYKIKNLPEQCLANSCCSNKTINSVHVNPKFKSKLGTESSKLKNLNCGEHAMSENLRIAHARAKLACEIKKSVCVNPKFTALKQGSKERGYPDKPTVSPEKIALLVEKKLCALSGLLNRDSQSISQQPCTKLEAYSQVPQGENRTIDVSGTIAGKQKVVQKSNTLLAPYMTPASRDIRTNSLVVLSKTKLVRRSIKCPVKRTCEDQQTVVVCNTSKKLVKRRRSLNVSPKVAKAAEMCSGVKLSPRFLPLSPPTKVAKSLRTKYKIVRGLSVPDKQAINVPGVKDLSSPLSKLQNHNPVTNSSSNVAKEVKPTENMSAARKTVPRDSLILLSKTKLIRRGAKCTVRKNSRDQQMVTILNNARKLVRKRRSSLNMSPKLVRTPSHSSTMKLTQRVLPQPPAVKVMRSVRTKYKYIRSLSDQKNRRMSCEAAHSGRARLSVKSKYNIDRRAQRSPRTVKRVRKYCVNYREETAWGGPARTSSLPYRKRVASHHLFGRKPAPGSLVWKNANYLQVKWTTGNNRRLQLSEKFKEQSVKTQRSILQHGEDRRCDVQALCQQADTNEQLWWEKYTQGSGWHTSLVYCVSEVPKQGHIVHIRGNKFLMESSGRTMRRISAPSSHNPRATRQKVEPPVTRIDIGGVTFLQKSQNVLIRTDYHRARNILSQAKQRSIATLTQKLKNKNNQPCIVYQQFGKCSRKETGTCPRVHDPKQIALCKKFLQGRCQIAGCPLSHDVVPEKMPTCHFFLEGVCVRDNCPYLHVKLNSKAGICVGFLQGYCVEGNKCLKRHVNLCPDFDRLGKCSRGKFCPYPHKVGSKRRAKKRKLPATSTGARSKFVPSKKSVVHRYYENPSMTKPSDTAVRTEATSSSDACLQYPSGDDSVANPAEEAVVACKRRKLAPMPDYIAFTFKRSNILSAQLKPREIVPENCNCLESFMLGRYKDFFIIIAIIVCSSLPDVRTDNVIY
ncbi:hypothetical protein PR048_033709 [Dryococelus australis]|uniref:C3H1-type domain-containing protein n=1 Tax=Dryococelus australis TaxID=614101 RepID=A0ABQ9G111_9NEOP|nr:hypothetical protein PR048_033709 [Dryococelus australis]